MDMHLADDLLTRIQMEFVEMPDLRLTVHQAGRFWNVPDGWCEQIFQLLVERRFLMRTDGGVFLRPGEFTQM